MFGVDISEHNGDVNFENLRNAGFEFVIIRCGYGMHEDSNFLANVSGAFQAGLKFGAYHYSYSLTPSQCEDETRFIKELISSTGCLFELPIFLDMEDDNYKKNHFFNYSRDSITSICKTYIDNIGLNAGVYAPYSWLENKIFWKQLNCPIWSAQWGRVDNFKGFMWQFSDSWEIGNKTFDVNYCYN